MKLIIGKGSCGIAAGADKVFYTIQDLEEFLLG